MQKWILFLDFWQYFFFIFLLHPKVVSLLHIPMRNTLNITVLNSWMHAACFLSYYIFDFLRTTARFSYPLNAQVSMDIYGNLTEYTCLFGRPLHRHDFWVGMVVDTTKWLVNLIKMLKYCRSCSIKRSFGKWTIPPSVLVCLHFCLCHLNKLELSSD